MKGEKWDRFLGNLKVNFARYVAIEKLDINLHIKCK